MKSRKFRLEIVGPLLLACFSICTSALAQEKEEPKKAPSSADTITAGEDRKTHVRLGGFSIGAGYSHYSGPYYYDPYYYPFYPAVWGLAGTFWSPFYDLYSPLYRPGPYWQYSPSAGMGEVKLQGTQKSAEVFLERCLCRDYRGLEEHLVGARCIRSGSQSWPSKIQPAYLCTEREVP
jgi:hypothetical protein